jgi:bifunctional DNase/RNase
MLEMSIDSIRVSLMNYQRVVILKEKDADRYLPIWIGPSEADAITVKLQGVTVPRPLTHDLLGNVIDALGGTVKHIVVSELFEETFYAKIILELGDNTKKEVDARTSDAIALAVRTNVPIYVEEPVLEKAGVQLDKETGKADVVDNAEDGRRESKAPGEEELKGMSAFTDFVEGLDLGDLEKGTST